MNEFLMRKSQLRSAVFNFDLDTGSRFEEALDAVEACETAEQLLRCEKWLRLLAAEEGAVRS